MSSEDITFSIRRMRAEDIEAIRKIEVASFSTPWSEAAFAFELAKPFSIPLVAVMEAQVIGYGIGWLIVDEMHIANLAVHPAYRRRGVGEALIRRLMTWTPGIDRVALEVREGNVAARALYRKIGFIETGVRKGYYAGEGEDAILMTWIRKNPEDRETSEPV